MTKRVLFKKIKDHFNNSYQDDIKEILEKYDAIIEDKKLKGMSEKEAVKSLGSIDDIINKIEKKLKKENSDMLDELTDNFVKEIDEIINMISKKKPRELIKFVIEIFLITLIIAVVHIPISNLINLGKDVFNIFAGPINRFFFLIWRFVLEFAYFLFSLLAFVTIFKKRYLKEEITKKKHESVFSNLSKTILKILIFILKLLAITLLFGLSIYLVGMALILVICIYLLIHQVTYFGFYIVMITLFSLGVIFFFAIFNFVLDKKSKTSKMVATIFINFILLGVGCGIATIEVANTDFVDTPPKDLVTDSLVEELPMEKNVVFIGNVSDFVTDNTINNVKIEYIYYPLSTTMQTKITRKENFVYLDWDMYNLYLKKEFINHFINDLKSKKVYNYYIEPIIKITANEKNIKKIKDNRNRYYKGEKNYSSCEFVKTYYIEMIKEIKDSEEEYLVLSNGMESELATIKIKKSLAKNVTAKSYYEFTFQTYQSYLDDDIEDLFNNNAIINIKKTDKDIKSQRQDKSCTIFY